MTSVRLSTNARAGLRMFVWSMRKNGLITGIASIIALLVSPGFQILEYTQNRVTRLSDITNSFQISTFCLMLLTGLLVFLFSAMQFQFLHSKKATDVFLSLPITRGMLLLSRFLAAAVSAMIPAAISLLVLAFFIMPGMFTGVGVAGIFKLLLDLFVCTAGCTAFCMLFAVATGNTFDMVVSILTISAGWPAVVLLLYSYFAAHVTGFLLKNVSIFWLLLCSPFAKAAYSVGIDLFYITEGSVEPAVMNWLSILLWIVTTVLLVAVCMFLVKRRKGEMAEQPYAFRFVPIALAVFVTICGGFLLGAIFANEFEASPLFLIFFLIGALLSSVIIGAIFYRGFRKTKQYLLLAGIVFIAFGLFATGVRMGGFGYEKRVPDPQTVTQVTIETDGLPVITFDTPQTVALVTELHQAIVDDIGREEQTVMETKDVHYGSVQTNTVFRSLQIRYQKRFGEVERAYTIDTSRFAEYLLPLLKTEAFIDSLQPPNLSKGTIQLEVGIVITDAYETISLTERQFHQLYEHLRQDFRAMDASYFSDPILFQLSLYSRTTENNEIYKNHLIQYFSLTDDFSQTISFLEAAGVDISATSELQTHLNNGLDLILPRSSYAYIRKMLDENQYFDQYFENESQHEFCEGFIKHIMSGEYGYGGILTAMTTHTDADRKAAAQGFHSLERALEADGACIVICMHDTSGGPFIFSVSDEAFADAYTYELFDSSMLSYCSYYLSAAG